MGHNNKFRIELGLYLQSLSAIIKNKEQYVNHPYAEDREELSEFINVLENSIRNASENIFANQAYSPLQDQQTDQYNMF